MKKMTEEEMMKNGYLTSQENALKIEALIKKHHKNKVDRVM